MPAVVSRPRGPSLLVPANDPSTCVSSAAIQRGVSADTGPVVARLPAAAGGASCVVPGALQRCLSAFVSVSLLPEPVAPRAAPAAAPGARRAVRRVSTPGPSPVASMARGPPPPARAPCTRVYSVFSKCVCRAGRSGAGRRVAPTQLGAPIPSRPKDQRPRGRPPRPGVASSPRRSRPQGAPFQVVPMMLAFASTFKNERPVVPDLLICIAHFGSTSVGPRTKIVNRGSPRPVFSFACDGQPDQIVNL